MPLSLYDAFVPSCRQIVGAVVGLVDKAETFCAERGVAPGDILQARLAEDMLPLAYQVKSVAVHSAGAIEGVRKGVFPPDMTPPPDSFAGLKARLAEADAALAAVDPAELESYAGRETRFEFGERRMPFTTENFLLSFSQPNFYFHAATVYGILRWKGVAIGKRDFMGMPRMKIA